MHCWHCQMRPVNPLTVELIGRPSLNRTDPFNITNNQGHKRSEDATRLRSHRLRVLDLHSEMVSRYCKIYHKLGSQFSKLKDIS